MAEELDYNDALEDIVLAEERLYKNKFSEGYQHHINAGYDSDLYHTGYHRGADLGLELGKHYKHG